MSRADRCLTDLPAGAFLAFVPGCVAAELETSGYRLQAHTRAFWHRDGRVSVRMVWRTPRGGGSVMMNLVLRGTVPNATLEALLAAADRATAAGATAANG